MKVQVSDYLVPGILRNRKTPFRMIIVGDQRWLSGKKKTQQNRNSHAAGTVITEVDCFSNP